MLNEENLDGDYDISKPDVDKQIDQIMYEEESDGGLGYSDDEDDDEEVEQGYVDR